jgi:hypothetical protein
MMNYQDYIKPELLILIPVLYIMGLIIKSTEAIKNKYIPAILGLAGIALASLYVIATEGLTGTSLFTAITQGILAAGAAVYANELIDQLGGKKDE